MKHVLRYLSIFLVVIIFSLSLASCAPRPLAHSGIAKKIVGTVGSHNVYYEELYCLANSYYPTAKAKYGDDSEAIKNAVWDYVKENITVNYAILDLCAQSGLEYNESELQAEVNKAIELTIESSFEGNQNAYFEAQLDAGITDHYYRFCTGVDILYSKLATEYQTSGRIPNTDAAITDYIKQNFIHTWHIAIYVDKNDNRDAEYAKAEEALKLLSDGNSMYQLIGSQYNENTVPETLTDAYGYYFPRGVMDKAYEDAAFALEKSGDRSGIVTTYSTSPSGAYVECFYIIEKLPTSDKEIQKNFVELSDMMRDAIVSSALEAEKAKLSFTPNDYALSLDVTNLEAPKNGVDYQLIIAIALSILGIAIIVAAVFVFRTVRAKRFQKKHKNNKH